MKPLGKYLIARLKEPSTYGGLAVLLGAYHIAPEVSASIITVGIAVGGLLAVLFP